LAVTITGIAATNGYSDIRSMNKVQGIGVDPSTSKDFTVPVVEDPVASIEPAAVANAATKPVQAHKQPVKQKLRLPAKAKPGKPIHVSIPDLLPKPANPTVPTSPGQITCFDAPTEGIYVPKGHNSPTITITADRDIYWRTMSAGITNSDAGLDVPAEFPAYIVLESEHDPDVATKSLSFHLHARDNAPFGQYCPKNSEGKIGLIGYTERPEDGGLKFFDIPMNINIVEWNNQTKD
jgi:hypothetical protein